MKTSSNDTASFLTRRPIAGVTLTVGITVFLIGAQSANAQPWDTESDCGWAVQWLEGEAEITATKDLMFIRGDSNWDGEVDVSDPIKTLLFLFTEGRELLCQDAADSNDDGTVDISDPIHTLRFLLAGGQAIPAPFVAHGDDPTQDWLGCAPAPAADRWVFTLRPRVCGEGGCDPWLGPEDERTPQGHLAAFRRWALAGGANLVATWTQEIAEVQEGYENFEIGMILRGAVFVPEIIQTSTSDSFEIVLAPPDVVVLALEHELNYLIDEMPWMAGSVLATRDLWYGADAGPGWTRLDLLVLRGPREFYADMFVGNFGLHGTFIFPRAVVMETARVSCCQYWAGCESPAVCHDEDRLAHTLALEGYGPESFFLITSQCGDYHFEEPDRCGRPEFIYWAQLIVPPSHVPFLYFLYFGEEWMIGVNDRYYPLLFGSPI